MTVQNFTCAVGSDDCSKEIKVFSDGVVNLIDAWVVCHACWCVLMNEVEE